MESANDRIPTLSQTITLNQKGIAEGKSRWFCWACMKGFGAEGGGRVCAEGHRGEAERTAAKEASE